MDADEPDIRFEQVQLDVPTLLVSSGFNSSLGLEHVDVDGRVEMMRGALLLSATARPQKAGNLLCRDLTGQE